ncbi:MAG: OmpH family outer membrane protein [Steroidobacteraceae bacterium]
MVKSLVWGAAAALILATSPAWADLKIGYVNYSQLMQESPQAKAILAQLRAEFLPRQNELAKLQATLKTRADKYQRDAPTMTDDQREREQTELQDSDRDLQRRQSELQDDFTTRRNEELSSLQRILVQQVQTYAKAQNFDLVLADGVIYSTSTIDITPAILARLQQASGAGATAPRKAKSSH